MSNKNGVIVHANTVDRVINLESVSSKHDERPGSNASKYFTAQFKMTP